MKPSRELANGAVSSPKIAASAITGVRIADNAVSASEIAEGAVGPSELDGRFCLVKRGGFQCPSGYTEYYIRWDTEDSDNGDICTESVAQWCSSAGSFIDLAFCCK